jgi:hypothetical protein
VEIASEPRVCRPDTRGGIFGGAGTTISDDHTPDRGRAGFYYSRVYGVYCDRNYPQLNTERVAAEFAQLGNGYPQTICKQGPKFGRVDRGRPIVEPFCER